MNGVFRHKGLAEIYHTGTTRRIGPEYVRKCARILSMLEAATQPEELNVVALHLHRLRGKPRRWSVRISAHYRITFGWSGEYAPEIDFEDYH